MNVMLPLDIYNTVKYNLGVCGYEKAMSRSYRDSDANLISLCQSVLNGSRHLSGSTVSCCRRCTSCAAIILRSCLNLIDEFYYGHERADFSPF